MRPAPAAVALVGAVVWAVAIALLWRTRVPGDLNVPKVDLSDYFSASELRRASSYSRFERISFLLSTATLVGVLAAYARRGGRFARESAAGRIGTGMLLGMIGFALVWLSQVPFQILDLWWERRHGIAKVGYFEELFGGWLALAGEFLFICLALLIVMGLARLLGERWWILGAPAFVGIAVLFAFVSPWLMDTHPLRNPALAAEARALERAEGVARTPVEVEDVHEFTTAPNAEATGFGASRRIVLWDTLLDGRFDRPQIRFVLAHEVGHIARSHIPKSVAWYALFAFPGTFLIARATRRKGGMAEPRAVPLSLLVLVVLSLLALPLQNVVVRHLEAEADWMALETTRDPAAGRGLFRRFATTALEEPSPPTWAYLLLENHPTLAQRIAFVNAWQARHRRGSAAQAASAQSP